MQGEVSADHEKMGVHTQLFLILVLLKLQIDKQHTSQLSLRLAPCKSHDWCLQTYNFIMQAAGMDRANISLLMPAPAQRQLDTLPLQVDCPSSQPEGLGLEPQWRFLIG